MSVLKIATAAVTALSLAAVPTLGQAAPAASRLAVTAPTGVAIARVGARTTKANEARGGSGLIIAILALAAVGVGIALAVSNSHKTPTSA